MRVTKNHNSPSAEALEIVKDLPSLVTLDGAAKFLCVTTRTIRRWIRVGKLKAYRTHSGGAGRVLVSRTEIARMLDAMRIHVPFEP